MADHLVHVKAVTDWPVSKGHDMEKLKQANRHVVITCRKWVGNTIPPADARTKSKSLRCLQKWFISPVTGKFTHAHLLSRLTHPHTHAHTHCKQMFFCWFLSTKLNPANFQLQFVCDVHSEEPESPLTDYSWLFFSFLQAEF